MFLRRKYKKQAYEIAAYHWNKVHLDRGNESEDANVERIKDLVARDIESRRFALGGSSPYNSVLASILITLMIKFAMRCLERWIEKRLFSVSSNYDRQD